MSDSVDTPVKENEEQQTHHRVANGSDSDHKAQSKLLALPAELRNKIYKYCLIIGSHDAEYSTIDNRNGRFVVVTEDVKQPALLSVCRQVRNEALGFWYIENKFHVRINDYDASLYLAWRRHLNALGPKFKAQTIGYKISGDPDWKKLKEWCYAVWSGLPQISDKRGDEDRPEAEIVDAAHGIAYASRGKTWKKCEHQLEGLRKVLGQVDEEWLD